MTAPHHETGKKNPEIDVLQAEVDQMKVEFDKVCERIPRQPGFLERMWNRWYVRYPLITGALIAGGVGVYFGWQYIDQFIKDLKKMLENYNKELAEKVAKAREGVQKANSPQGQSIVIDQTTQSTPIETVSGGGGSTGGSLKQIVDPAAAKKIVEETTKKVGEGTFQFPRRNQP